MGNYRKSPKWSKTKRTNSHFQFLNPSEATCNYRISFGGIPNSSSIDILMPYAIFDYMAAFLHSGFAHVDNVIPVIKTITWLLLSRLQGSKPHRNSPEPSEPCLQTVRNCPEPSEPCLRNLHQPSWNSPEPSGTNRSAYLRNLSPAYTGTLRNLAERNLHHFTPEPSGTRFRNLHQHTLELSRTFQNLPEPSGTSSGTSSGTYSCDPHRHTPELIWAEDPISLRCWGKNMSVKLIICCWKLSFIVFYTSVCS